MRLSLSKDKIRQTLKPALSQPDEDELLSAYGPPVEQPVHLMVGGAQRFRAGTSARMGQIALQTMNEYAPDFVTFARAMGLPGAVSFPSDPEMVGEPIAEVEGQDRALEGDRAPYEYAVWLADSVYRQVRAKLQSEPVECYCIDFEDGYGAHPEDVEDADAKRAAKEIADGLEGGQLPARLGIRIKPLTKEFGQRAARTLDIVVSSLLTTNEGRLPPNFFVLLAKASTVEQVAALSDLLFLLEEEHGLAEKTISTELLIETPEAMVDGDGRWAVGRMVEAAQGRCTTVHFGLYDYTSALGITAAHQRADHLTGDIARHLLQLSLIEREVRLSDGPIMALPIAPHRQVPGQPLGERERLTNRNVIHQAWQICYQGIWHALQQGYYQGWDLHPNQLPARYAATYTFFRQELAANTSRLRNFVAATTGATRLGTVFDDPATVRALLNYFRRAYSCGAITAAEVEATGLTIDKINRPTFEEVFPPSDGS